MSDAALEGHYDDAHVTVEDSLHPDHDAFSAWLVEYRGDVGSAS